MQKPLVPKKYQKIMEDKIKWDEAKGGHSFTPGYKPHLSVRTAKKGSLLTTGLKGYDTKKVSSKTHQKFMKLFKHREAGGWKEAKGYKKHLKALKKMQKTPLSGMSTTLPPKTARLLSQLKFAYKDRGKFAKFAKDATKSVGVFPYVKGKASTAMGKADPSTFLKRRMILGMGRPTALSVLKKVGKRTGIGKAVVAATATVAGYKTIKHQLKKQKDNIKKKSIGGETVVMKSGGGYIDNLL